MGGLHYDAKLGRFISEDPIGFGGGDVNLFGYVGNNPQNFVDPYGLSAVIRLAKFINQRGKQYLVDTRRKLTMKQAQNIRRNEGNVIVDGKNSQKLAEQIETGAFKNDPVAGNQLRHDPHGDEVGFLPHYQTNKYQGHTFYKSISTILAPNIVNLSESSCTTNEQFASAIMWDGVSLFDPIGLTDAIEAGSGLDGGEGGVKGLANFAIDNSPILSSARFLF